MAVSQGVLTRSPCRGIRFTIHDAILHTDAIHRGGGQMIPTARRCFMACQLSNIRLFEPIYKIDAVCHGPSVNSVTATILNTRESAI